MADSIETGIITYTERRLWRLAIIAGILFVIMLAVIFGMSKRIS